MTILARLERWKEQSKISPEQHALLAGLSRGEPFSLFLELNILLYAGILASGHAEHHERHIIVLGSACGKRLCGGQDSTHAFQSWKPMTRFGEFDQSLFAPFFVANVHGFGNSVRKEHQ